MIEELQVIWYDVELQRYQFGRLNDYLELRTALINPDRLLLLERFNRESPTTIAKVVTELNKCKVHPQVHYK